MIEYIDVCKRYGEKTILSHFDITIDCGTFLTIIGTSGSGKTTILKMINGLVKPDCGKILINGKDIQEEDLIQLRRNIGYSIQGNILFPHLTVFENIAYVLRLQERPEEEIKKIVSEKLAMIKLPLEIQDRYPHQLSGGQQQRVGIARALASSPDILLMDEPFGAVDAITRHELQRELKMLHRNTNLTVVFITHDITEALKLGTKILVMDNGAVQQFGTPDEIKNNPANEFVKTLVDMANN